MATEPEHPTGELGSQGSRLSTQLRLSAPLLPCRAHLQPKPGLPENY